MEVNKDSQATLSTNNHVENKDSNQKRIKRDVYWPMVLYILHVYILGFYGVYIMFTSAKLTTTLFTLTLAFLGVLGVTAGSHRLWAHKTYKAEGPLKVFLMICQTLAGQGCIYDWVQKHRLHHAKFRQEDDPYFSSRDFTSAHIYAQVMNLTPEQNVLLEQIDMSDLKNDKVVMFQKKFYWILCFVLHVLLPINAPLEYWGDTVSSALLVAFSLRCLLVLNAAWLVNSAHFIWGLDKSFKPSESNSVFFITKSYWPQYHYLLPDDYQSGEYGGYADDFTTAMIRVFAALGLATDLRTITSLAVRNGLTVAVDTGRPVVECIEEEAEKEMQTLPKNHFLNREKFM